MVFGAIAMLFLFRKCLWRETAGLTSDWPCGLLIGDIKLYKTDCFLFVVMDALLVVVKLSRVCLYGVSIANMGVLPAACEYLTFRFLAV